LQHGFEEHWKSMNSISAVENSSGNKWLIAGFASTIVMFVAIALSAFLGISAYQSHIKSATESNDLHLKLDDLSLALRDVQRGARGYVTTEDSTFLPPYREGCLKVAR
jgi:CHASE3 domain sensor protein